MADSDDEYDRKRGRDKFRRERNDYDHRRDDRRRESWEGDRYRGGSRNRRDWSNNRDRGRDSYGRDYDRGYRDRGYSPRREMSPPHPKRMRRDWDDGGYPPYDMPHYGGPPPRGPPPNWGPGPDMGPPPQGGFGGGPGPNVPDPDFPTQPPMMTFKAFLASQDDTISDQDAIKKYNEYKEDFKRQQINEFFLAHKDEEWFKSKYHPEEFEKRQEEVRGALRQRCRVFLDLLESGRFFTNLSVDTEKHEELVKLLDAAVIKMEGGTDEDLLVLEEPEAEGDRSRSRNNSESLDKSPEKRKREDSKDEKVPDKPLEITITAEQKELMKKAQEFSKKQQAQNGEEDEEEKKPKKKKRRRDKTEYSYESGSESESGTDSEPEPAPPGLEDEPPPPGLEGGSDPLDIPGVTSSEDKKGKAGSKEDQAEEEKDEDTKNTSMEDKPVKPRTCLHKTCSIFLRNLAPSITKQEVEAVCKRYPGFIRVALQDPQPERRFFRRGWVTFDKDVNIKEICWNLNNIRLRDCDLGATLNRELKQRIRPVSGLTAHKTVVKQDIKLAAKIIHNFDTKWKIWEDTGSEKKDEEKDSGDIVTVKSDFSLTSKNPVLKNITDYLVDEGSFEEEELLGKTEEEGEADANPEINVDRDEALNKVLDRMVLYLRIVHSIDYYSANEYPNEDEMPHRCGIMHARGVPPSSKLTQQDLDDWLKNFENKVKPFVELHDQVEATEATKLGKKDPNAEVEKFVTANTQELAKDKWLCPISGKKFKGPEFVRKHIFNKHGEKVEEVKKEVAFFNNYLLDPKRPQLAEHPGNKQQGTPGSGGAGQGSSPAGHFQGPPQPGMMGYNQPRGPPMMGYGGGPPPYGGRSYDRRDHYPRDDPPFRRSGYSRPYSRSGPPYKRTFDHRRSDPRSVIEYRDLDAPDDGDIF